MPDDSYDGVASVCAIVLFVILLSALFWWPLILYSWHYWAR